MLEPKPSPLMGLGMINQTMDCCICFGELVLRVVDCEGRLLQGWACDVCHLLWSFENIVCWALDESGTKTFRKGAKQ